jgi:hypothetical protein
MRINKDIPIGKSIPPKPLTLPVTYQDSDGHIYVNAPGWYAVRGGQARHVSYPSTQRYADPRVQRMSDAVSKVEQEHGLRIGQDNCSISDCTLHAISNGRCGIHQGR